MSKFTQKLLYHFYYTIINIPKACLDKGIVGTLLLR